MGQTLGQYHILSAIGAGAMGEVYLARDTRLDRQVALKIPPARFTRSSERVARFRREAKAASALNHPNIITIYDIGQRGDIWFIAVELIEGVTLRQRLAAGRMELQEDGTTGGAWDHPPVHAGAGFSAASTHATVP